MHCHWVVSLGRCPFALGAPWMRPENAEVKSVTGPKTFGREWLKAPLRVGAIRPSSERLAEAITAGISPDTGPVVELGPGTGVMTRAILARGVAPRNLAAIELGTRFAEALRAKHPDIHVIQGDAGDVARIAPFEPGTVGHVVCGLPLISLPGDLVERILIGSFELLRPSGAFTLFTYGPRCPERGAALMRHGLRAKKTSRTLRNLPPAVVYEIRRSR